MCTVLAKLQESATLVTNWHDSNLLKRNLKKYQTMSIRNKSVTCDNFKLLLFLTKDNKVMIRGESKSLTISWSFERG